MQTRFLAFFVLLLTVHGCRSTDKGSNGPDYPPIKSSELGTMHNVVVSNGLWFGGMPSLEDLDLAKRRGIERVINLCTIDEHGDFDVRQECARLNLECVDIGLRKGDEIPDAAVDEVIARLDTGVKTLMFCRDGSRSAMFFAIHRVVNGGMSVDKANVEARQAGMHPGWSEEFVQRQVDRILSVSGTY